MAGGADTRKKPEGLDHFYRIFADYENMGDPDRATSEFLCPNLTAFKKEKGKEKVQLEEQRKDEFKAWLKKARRSGP